MRVVNNGAWSMKKLEHPDSALQQSYEAEVRQVLENAGFKVRFVEADKLIFTGGSVHRTTMQVPW